MQGEKKGDLQQGEAAVTGKETTEAIKRVFDTCRRGIRLSGLKWGRGRTRRKEKSPDGRTDLGRLDDND